ncbi:hypothetical protein CLCR_07801 [Cladophialophora carrionii]|uniref:Uncharacterized protein n=1 Tax=Cladophialophora carrionii TaxID=86049 RepID=A0A1C1CQP2_9EURO|nr:hypothetical protein CLCR_07801 [Cladophialophora carrionii]
MDFISAEAEEVSVWPGEEYESSKLSLHLARTVDKRLIEVQEPATSEPHFENAATWGSIRIYWKADRVPKRVDFFNLLPGCHTVAFLNGFGAASSGLA